MTASVASLPSYSQPEIPSYTAQPRGGEQRLGQGRLPRFVDLSRLRDWTASSTAATLTLADQPIDAELPTFGRQTDVRGSVSLHSTEGIVSVTLKLHGYVKCKTIAEIGSSETVVLNLPMVLWQARDGSTCPNILPFEIQLPSTYTWNGETGVLPPTFEYTFYDVQGGTPGLKAKVKYEISLEIEHGHATLKNKLSPVLSTQFTYHPRNRPAVEPAKVPSSVFDAVMQHRIGKSKEEDPIVWKLRLPPPGTYPLTQPIPFGVTVTSRTSSLIAPFAPTNKRDKAAIRVYILRQVSICVNKVDLWRSYVIGEGHLNYIPPSLDGLWLKNVLSRNSKTSLSSDSSKEGWACQEWEGELRVDKDITVGGFKVGDMAVKDFIVMSVVPPNPRLGTLLEVKRVVPIQLTTDEYLTEYALPPPLDTHIPTNEDALEGYLEGRGEGHLVDSHATNGNGVHHHNGSGVDLNAG